MGKCKVGQIRGMKKTGESADRQWKKGKKKKRKRAVNVAKKVKRRMDKKNWGLETRKRKDKKRK